MAHRTTLPLPVQALASVPPPRRRRARPPLGLDAVQVLTRLGLLPLAGQIVGLAHLSQRRLPAHPPRGRRRTYSDASILVLALLGRLSRGHYSRALAIATELGMRPLAAHCHLGLGTLYQKGGRDAEAQADLTTAAEMYRAMDMP